MRRAILGLALLTLFVLAPPASAWTWPLHGDVLRPYSLGPDPYAAGQHRGVDVGGAAGEPSVRPPPEPSRSPGVVPGSGRTVTIQARRLRRLAHTSRRDRGSEGSRCDRGRSRRRWPARAVMPSGRRRTSTSGSGSRQRPTAISILPRCSHRALCCRPRPTAPSPAPSPEPSPGAGTSPTPIVTPPPAATPTPGAGSPSTTPAPAAPSVPAPATPAPAAGGVPLPESVGTGPAPAGAARGTPVPAPASTTVAGPSVRVGSVAAPSRVAPTVNGATVNGSTVNGSTVSGSAAAQHASAVVQVATAPSRRPGRSKRPPAVTARAPPRLVEGTRAAPQL